MTGKTALRAVWQAEITLTDVRVPAENRLANCPSFKDVAQVLDRTRYTVAWRALGLATASYELALAHALRREQFGQPIAGFQLVQDKLARMLAEITSMQLMCWRLSKLADAGRMTAAMASLAKMNHAAKARAIVADARDILGGDGILLDNHVARHHADMEAIFTFEGTDSVQALIVGREITGLSAISGRKPTRVGATSVLWPQRPGARACLWPLPGAGEGPGHGGQPGAVRTGGAPGAHPRPLLRAPHLDDRPADGELDLAVELGRGPVRLHGVPWAAVLRRMPVRPSVGAGEPHRVGLHVEPVPHVTAGQSPLSGAFGRLRTAGCDRGCDDAVRGYAGRAATDGTSRPSPALPSVRYRSGGARRWNLSASWWVACCWPWGSWPDGSAAAARRHPLR